MTEPLLEDQLLGLAPRTKLIVGVLLLLLGAVACMALWERGLIVGAAVFVLVMGGLMAWTGRQELARAQAIDAEVARARAKWEDLEREVATARSEGKSVARVLQAHGFREFVVRRWIMEQLGVQPEGGADGR